MYTQNIRTGIWNSNKQTPIHSPNTFFFVLYINIYIYHHPNRSYTALFDMYRSVFFYRRTIRSRKTKENGI